MFDFWYGPGVLTDPPTSRRHVRLLNGTETVRSVQPTMNWVDNSVRLDYSIENKGPDGLSIVTRETHVMRYFFAPELTMGLASCGLEVVQFSEATSWRVPLTGPSWTAACIARRR